MKTHVLSNEQLTAFLQQGDALINAGSEAIAATVPAVSVNSDGTARLINGPAYPLAGNSSAAVAAIEADDVSRFVIRGTEQQCEPFASAMEQAARNYVVCLPEKSCQADSFMDDEDSEAVAERLRQLGYL